MIWMGKTKKYDPPTSVRLDPETVAKLKKIGEQEGDRSVGSIIKQAVQEFVQRWEARGKKK